MTPVVGNMLQSDLACWIEARLAGGAAGHPAEMIGFQKMPAGLLAPSLDVADGALIPADTTRPTLDRETVGRLTGHVLTFPAA